MSKSIAFDRNHVVTHGQLEPLRPGLRRITANNASPFTFRGTGTLVLGNGHVAVIDPGPADPTHIDALMTALGNEVVTHILVTHTHQDHSPGCKLLKSRTGATTYGVAASARPSDQNLNEDGPDSEVSINSPAIRDSDDRDFVPDITLKHNDVITGIDWELQCIHTPGHASNHICFSEAATGSLFTGDHVMAWSSTVILQPDGSLQDYLNSLELLQQRNDSIYWPAHGGPVQEPQRFVEQLRAHRLLRGQQILQAVSEGINTVADLRKAVYPDLKQELHRGAMHSLLSTVVYLADTNQLHSEQELSFDSRLSLC